MAFFQITALLILIEVIAYKAKEKTVDVIPVAVCILTLVLYVLAFFNTLSFINYISIAVVAVAAIYMLKASAAKRKEFLAFVKDSVTQPGTIIAIFMIAAITVLVSGKIVTWWDDYNFWATDVKSLFYLDGFADKYQNVAPEFGDYPPGTQMLKWWFLHFSPEQFKEGFLFAGYYCMNFVFLFPLLKFIKKRNIPVMILSAIVLWLFPTTVESFGLIGACADLTMAMIYGAFLAAVVDSKEHKPIFYYGRLALYLMVLVLCKNVGFIWAAFGLLFAWGYHILVLRKSAMQSKEYKVPVKYLVIITILPVITEASWLIFCFINKRVAKLTGTAVKMAVGNMNIPDYSEQMVRSFAEAFVKWPLHRWETIAIDLSPLALFVLLLLFVFFLFKRKSLTGRQAIFTSCFFTVSGLFFYTFNLISHLTIFAVEMQYLEPLGMVSSIERYGAPFTIGGLYLATYMLLKGEEDKKTKETGGAKEIKHYKGIFICFAFVLLTADHKNAYLELAGYQQKAKEELLLRNELVDEAARTFLAKVGAGGDSSIGRVLYFRDISDVSWVRNTYIGFEAAPVSVMYGNIDGESAGRAEIEAAIKDSHAGYVYVDKLTGKGNNLLEEFTQEKEFEFATLYRVLEDNGAILLERAD